MASFLPRTFVILGVHRSATSFVAKALIDAGVKMSAGTNPHYEDGDFVRLNRSIIQGAGGDWRNPPSRETLLLSGQKHQEEIRELIRVKKADMWGWKDPRQALTIESYLPYLEDDVYLVCLFRKPELVGASLVRLKQTNNGEQLAREYNRRILAAVERFVGI